MPEKQYQADPSAFAVTPNGDVIVPLSLSQQEEVVPKLASPAGARPNRRPFKLTWMRKFIVPAIAVLILCLALRPQPLTYHVADVDHRFDISKSDVESILEDAAKRWNTALGKTAIRIDTGTKGNAVSLVFDYAQEYPFLVAPTSEIAAGSYNTSDHSITVYSRLDRQQLRFILMHELGHALGCGHTNTPGSIMYPELTSAARLANPVPTAEDLELAGGG